MPQSARSAQIATEAPLRRRCPRYFRSTINKIIRRRQMSYIKKALVASLSTCVISSMGVFGFGAQAHADTYHIRSILSVNGPAAFLGADMKAGIEMAFEEIKASGGTDGKKATWTLQKAATKTT